MRYFVLPLLLLVAAPAIAQKHSEAISPGKKKVEDAYGYQMKLKRGLITIKDAVHNWSKVAVDPDVKKDRDAQAIAYGCEGLMEIERGENMRADSLLSRAMPLFELKKSKAFFLVALADLDKKLAFYDKAMRSYEEIIRTMDSLPELDEISFYHESGYAPQAYAIDASLGVAKIGASIPAQKPRALALLKQSADKHETNALGLMSMVALKYLDKEHAEDYTFRINLLCSRKPELRKASDKFEHEFEALEKEGENKN